MPKARHPDVGHHRTLLKNKLSSRKRASGRGPSRDLFGARHPAADLKRLDLARDLQPDWFQRPDMAGYVFYIDRFNGSLRGVLETVETELKYEGYIVQQERQIARLKNAEGSPLSTT